MREPDKAELWMSFTKEFQEVRVFDEIPRGNLRMSIERILSIKDEVDDLIVTCSQAESWE